MIAYASPEMCSRPLGRGGGVLPQLGNTVLHNIIRRNIRRLFFIIFNVETKRPLYTEIIYRFCFF